MSRSKKDGRHGGGHKMHWEQDNCRGCCPYGYMDVHVRWCSQCKNFSICKKHSHHASKMERYEQERNKLLNRETRSYKDENDD